MFECNLEQIAWQWPVIARDKLVLLAVKQCYIFQGAISSSVLFLPACYFFQRAIYNNTSFLYGTFVMYILYTVY